MNNVLPFIKQFFIICIVLHVICYCIYIYKLHMCMWDQTRDVYSVRRVVLEWEDLKVMWAMQFPPSFSTATYTAHTATAKLQTAVGPAMQKGVQHAPI